MRELRYDAGDARTSRVAARVNRVSLRMRVVVRRGRRQKKLKMMSTMLVSKHPSFAEQ